MAVSDTPPLSRWMGGLGGKGWRTVTDERHDDPTGAIGANDGPSHGPVGPGGLDHKVIVCPICGRCETCDGHAEWCRIGQLEAENADSKGMVETLKREIDIGVETLGKLNARAVKAEVVIAKLRLQLMDALRYLDDLARLPDGDQ